MAILLMCASCDTRRIDFLQVDWWSTDTPVLGRHKIKPIHHSPIFIDQLSKCGLPNTAHNHQGDHTYLVLVGVKSNIWADILNKCEL